MSSRSFRKKRGGDNLEAQKSPRKGDFSAVAETLRSVARRYDLEDAFEKYAFVAKWDQIVGPSLAKKCSPEEIRGDTLFVRAQNSTWAQELSFHKRFILHRLRELTPELRQVNDIKFRVGG